jgi:hypothetical protein
MSGGQIMVVLIVLIASLASIYRAKHGYGRRECRDARRGGRMDSQQIGPSPRELELQTEVEALRDRVKVLERIATDEHQPQRLAAEIESLREK